MKKFLGFLGLVMALNFTSHAAPGDTTWVQANVNQLQWYGNYDSTVVFPPAGKSYRSIYMIFTLGKYVCPGSPTYCGDWDYTVMNYLMIPGGPTLELGRLITPYANGGAPRTPFTWTQNYVYEVTDYAKLLHDTATIRVLYSGYSGGFTANVRFAFIEGAPDREVVGINRLWGGSYSYGDTTHSGTRDINTHFPVFTDVAPDAAKDAELKFTISGHGSDPNNCNEFCSHSYYVYENGVKIDSYRVWRSNCGLNELYPQSGTWLYERANWCPGAMVYSQRHKMRNIFAGNNYSYGLQFEPYIGNGGASYTTEATLFYYGGLKKTLDASIEQIVAPNNDNNHWRENPMCGTPVIHVKNRGAATIDSIRIIYGVQDSLTQVYTWVGRLKTFEETDITLPAMHRLNTMAGDTISYKFTAKITNVNGNRDADSTNNIMHTRFYAAPLWPSSFRIFFLTNSEAISSTSNLSETAWQIFDMNGNVVAKRTDAIISKSYADTVKLPTGCYKLVLTDSSCDGLHWWVWDQVGGVSAGYFNVRKLNANVNINMHGYNYSGTYNNDFGCGFTQYFYTSSAPSNGVTNVNEGEMSIDAYPNPAQDVVNIDLTGYQQVMGTLKVVDALGRVVSSTDCNAPHARINVASLANGVYTVIFNDNNSQNNKLTTRLLIAK